ncbi:putative aminodeoxychorismate lyase [Pigmentiphaga humi]|uniref:Endolytic murein transglycosylase n=1 Tax=Pigmentiphaga humi TaxID=2478468 RepID=A0A3P4B0A7_9BURK|nr:endolytic transglycosylase MltG [Pigmentiphaga humi]VCU69724.1 putative aminodeoxychorismate lyase [Pigmentiphaga humi]
MPKRHFSLKRTLAVSFIALMLLALAGIGAAVAYLRMPLSLPSDKVDFVIDEGTTMRGIALRIREAGIDVPPEVLIAYARITGTERRIKAGGYEVVRGESLWTLLTRLARGDVTQREITFIEGWNFRQIRAALRRHPDVRQTLDGLDDAAVAAMVGASTSHPEGLFFPDTYLFAVGSSDIDILRRAHRAQQRELADVWGRRHESLPLGSPYEALILASIIEKETGLHTDRERIAGVFINRLRLGMPLQTDPTVIYGLGEVFDGNLRRRDLRADTPWNTYTRRGLPPTPISSPGRASLLAAVQPEPHKFLYFVSRGNGTSAFSETLDTHNRNVGRYQLGRGQTSPPAAPPPGPVDAAPADVPLEGAMPSAESQP